MNVTKLIPSSNKSILRLQGNFANGSAFVDTIRNNLLQCCNDIKDVSVSIVDALAPPDFALNSVLGKSNGLVMID